MSEQPTATATTCAVVRGFYEAAGRGDLDGVTALLSPEIVLFEPPFLPYGGTYRGVEAFLAVLGRLADIVDITSIIVDRIIADGDRAVAVLSLLDRRTGERAVVAEESLVREGRIQEIQVFLFDPQSLVGPEE